MIKPDKPKELRGIIFLLNKKLKQNIAYIIKALITEGGAPIIYVYIKRKNKDIIILTLNFILKILRKKSNIKDQMLICNPLIAKRCTVPVFINVSFSSFVSSSLLPKNTEDKNL